jgi:hypothetical protein
MMVWMGCAPAGAVASRMVAMTIFFMDFLRLFAPVSRRRAELSRQRISADGQKYANIAAARGIFIWPRGLMLTAGLRPACRAVAP